MAPIVSQCASVLWIIFNTNSLNDTDTYLHVYRLQVVAWYDLKRNLM
jgi:hypothetical protein